MKEAAIEQLEGDRLLRKLGCARAFDAGGAVCLNQHPITAIGQSFAIHAWSGSGPDYLYIHHFDDEAWHI